jgi:L-aminopeptidase/D-esterase-like protein
VGVRPCGERGRGSRGSPVWTPFDGDTVFCASTCRVDGDPLAVSLLAAAVVAEAIRDGVREATAAPGCPALSGR